MAKAALKEDKLEATTRVAVMEKQLEDLKSREAQLKSSVKVCTL